ncbi:putative F-box/LRR-repeat protein At5g54820 isoform X2 [Macadamia integrifolia]|uniref:putative F-box/LRR-repeat protein At5g54820 isoform X2 n=1 Tax=Macadamia integrifolia TaxID=60698 RepID=UPI001C4EB8FD|nr:putative F-box/LRR-repeat protein At5g54820 isoform X2 [Macadamia integrifolia]
MSRKLDLFDLLPETILFLIVSYLPFKDAAKTSILSKRWRYIWHATTNIEFIESFFRRPHMLHGGGRESQKRAFINYVGKWMMQYQEPKVLHNRLLDFIPPPVPLEARHLIMKVGLQERELPGILALLMYCPKLNTLTIKMGHVKFRDDGDPSVEFDFKAFCREREVGFQCLRENLKVIEVDLYQGMKSEEELLRYLLKEAQVLERITITTCKEMDPDDAYPDLYFRNALRVRDFEKASHNLLVSIL